MPAVEILANELGPAASVDAGGGGPLLDLCDAARAPVAFSCRSASCGTCRVDVVEGAALFEPPGRDERDVLEIFASPPSHRLACQAILRPGPGLVRLRWVNDG
jgi:ferredoxin